MGTCHKWHEGVVVMKMNKADTEPRSAKAEEVKICDICGEMIIGEYDYVRTRRKTELYLPQRNELQEEGDT
jgi:hypothetical protein